MNNEKAISRDFKAEMDEIMTNWNPTSEPQFLNDELRETILGMYECQSEITLATGRADGWPQANVVDIWNLGLMLYFQSHEASSKVQNIERYSRVSLTLTPSFKDFGEMQAITMAARAEKVTNKAEIGDLYHQFLKRLPHMKQFAEYEADDTAYPGPGMVVYRLKPVMGCVLDFTKGYGHWDYVQFRADDFPEWEVKYG